MPSNIGVLQRILNDIFATVQAGGAMLYPVLTGYLALFGSFALLWVCFTIMRGGHGLAQAIALVIRLGLVFLLLDRWPWMYGGLRDVALSLGLAATGNQLDVAEFLDPGMLVKAGLDSGAVLWTALQNNIGWRTPFVGAAFLVCWFVYVGAYMVMAWKVFWFQVELLLASLAGLCLMPTLAFRFTSFVAAGTLAYAANMFVRFLMTAILAGALWAHLRTLTTLVKPVGPAGLAAVDFTLQEAFYAMALAVILAAAFLSINRLAGMMTSGVPSLGGGDGIGGVIHMVSGGVSALVTSGAAAMTGALGAARVGAAGIQGAVGAVRAAPAALSTGSLGGGMAALGAGARDGMSGGAQKRIAELMQGTSKIGERAGAQTLHEFLGARLGREDAMRRGVHQ